MTMAKVDVLGRGELLPSYLDSVLTLYRYVKSATVGIYFKLHGAWSP